MHDILRNVRKQIDPLDAVADGPAAGDRDIDAILGGSDFQALLDESLRDTDDALETHSGNFAGPPAEASGSGQDAGGTERPSRFGTALGSMQPKHSAAADGHAGQPPGGQDFWERYPFLIDAAPEPSGTDAHSGSAARSSGTWRGITRQTVYILLVLLACIVLFRLLGPKKKEPSTEDLFQPDKADIEFLDAINYLEKYYDEHPELKSGNVVRKTADEPEGFEPARGPGGGTASDGSAAHRGPDAAAPAKSAP